MVDWPALYESMRRQIGVEYTLELGCVTTLDCQRFALASGMSTPEYLSVKETIPVEAPPLMVSAIMGWGVGPVEDEMRVDGSLPTDMARLGLPVEGLRLMGAGQTLDFYLPITSGQPLTMRGKLNEVELKSGRSGQFIILSIVRQYFDERENELLRCREQFIAR
jgi:hypothetical protein